jgi:hypothetical protein
MNWVWENRTWLFSGAGITVLVCVVWLIRHFWLAQKETAPGQSLVMAKVENSTLTNSPVAVGTNFFQTINVTNQMKEDLEGDPDYLRNPTQEEITQRIDAALPFDKAKVEENYLGLAVRWKINLQSVEKSFHGEPGVWTVAAKGVGAVFSGIIVFDVPELNYPRLKIHPSTRPLEVAGIISKITAGGLTIRLRDARVFFPDDAQTRTKNT